MGTDICDSLAAEYGFERVNGVTSSKVEESDRIDSYELGAADLNFYRINPTFGDRSSPFRPSETVVGKIIDKTGCYPRKRYVAGSEDNLEDVRNILSG